MEKSRELPSVGQLLKAFRMRKDIGQKEVGRTMNVNRNKIGMWENDKPIKREDILRLQSALRLTDSETDLLLYAAGYPLAYGSSVAEAARILGYEIGPEGQSLNRRETGAPGRVYGYLFVKRGDEVLGSYELRREQLIIGRHPAECDIVIPEEFTRTSRMHAKISRNQGGVYIEDKGSKHQTFVDGQRVDEPTLLKPGQRILLGSRLPRAKVCELEFSWEPASTD